MSEPRHSPHQAEIDRKQRFSFGKNWASFLESLDEERVNEASRALVEMLGDNLQDKRFLDAGSGSGLMSLAARRLGAKVFSFDYDPDSVACTAELRRRYFPEDSNWEVVEGSVLDRDFLTGIGQADVVYSWGVLHHTGRMWEAIEKVQELVAENGVLFIAIYNDQGPVSRFWRAVKKLYISGPVGRTIVQAIWFPYFFAGSVVGALLRGQSPFALFGEYKRKRGMSLTHDWRDWLGGYPFEVARPEELLDNLSARGFILRRMKTTNRLGCNELVFQRSHPVG